MMATTVLGVLRDAVAFGIYFAGVALEATARRMTDAIQTFEEDQEDLRDVRARRDEPSRPLGIVGGYAVELSPTAVEMLAEGRRSTRVEPEPRTGPLAGSVAARFARRA